jgi:hypothetical protein
MQTFHDFRIINLNHEKDVCIVHYLCPQNQGFFKFFLLSVYLRLKSLWTQRLTIPDLFGRVCLTGFLALC